MLYAICFRLDNNKDISEVDLYDPYMCDKFSCCADDVRKMLQNNVRIANIKLCSNKLVYSWTKSVKCTDSWDILNGYSIKIVSSRKGKSPRILYTITDGFVDQYVMEEELGKYNLNEIANYSPDAKGKFFDITNLTPDKQVVKYLAEQYSNFSYKAQLLGMNVSFQFSVMGKYIILNDYTGTSQNIIIPKFVDIINGRAFVNSHIKTVTLNEGLKVIGRYAFFNTKIQRLTIPSTVQFIGPSVLDTNYNMSRLSLLNKNTVVFSR